MSKDDEKKRFSSSAKQRRGIPTILKKVLPVTKKGTTADDMTSCDAKRETLIFTSVDNYQKEWHDLEFLLREASSHDWMADLDPKASAVQAFAERNL